MQAMELRRQVEQNAFGDDERRKRAGEMALRLSRLMNVDDGEESE